MKGAKTPFCDKFRPVHNCVREKGKGLNTCVDCGKMEECPTLEQIAANSPFVLENLNRLRDAKKPMLTWTNELMPIKQSAPVVITLFGEICYTVLLFADFPLLPGWMLGFTRYMACFIGVNVILWDIPDAEIFLKS